MSSVTSHYNIGGGLNPSKAIPIGESEDSYFNDAIDFLKQFKVVSANSMILYNQLKPFLSNIMYAPNGVDENFFKPSKINKYDNNNLTIGWVGKIKAAKNYETAKKSFVQLRKEGFKISEIALKKNVSKIRIKSPKKMKKYYQKIDYFLCSSWHEGTPNPALEAGASGVPIITTKVGNMPDLIKHNINGFFIEPNVESIVKQFNKLKNIHTDRYNELSKNIRLSILNDWTWEKKILRHDLTFKALLGNE